MSFILLGLAIIWAIFELWPEYEDAE